MRHIFFLETVAVTLIQQLQAEDCLSKELCMFQRKEEREGEWGKGRLVLSLMRGASDFINLGLTDERVRGALWCILNDWRLGQAHLRTCMCVWTSSHSPKYWHMHLLTQSKPPEAKKIALSWIGREHVTSHGRVALK